MLTGAVVVAWRGVRLPMHGGRGEGEDDHHYGQAGAPCSHRHHLLRSGFQIERNQDELQAGGRGCGEGACEASQHVHGSRPLSTRSYGKGAADGLLHVWRGQRWTDGGVGRRAGGKGRRGCGEGASATPTISPTTSDPTMSVFKYEYVW